MSKILVIDDDLSLRELLEMMLSGAGHEVTLAEDGCVGLQIALAEHFEVIISDIKMPGYNGLEVLKNLRASGCQTPVILISAYATPDTAVEAMHEEAFDFIPKPFHPQDLLTVVDSALAHKNVEQERQALAEMVMVNKRFGRMVGVSPIMLHVYDLIKRAAQTPTSILITGESGTGKELVARAVHENSNRAEKDFVAINCGSIPENLLESELFGHKKGSFTGASSDKKGLVSLAHGGTLFLDELAELPLGMQVKLLRVLQEKTFRPVGGDLEETSDVRFISATNKCLETEIMAGRFREDLYYRVNVINIQLPALRERVGDIPILAHFFLEKYSQAQGKNVRKLSAYALDILSRYHFPGNVRELENIIERSVALEQSNIILPDSLRLADFKRGEIARTISTPDSASPPFPQNPMAAMTPPHHTPPYADRMVWPDSQSHPDSLLTELPSGGVDELLNQLEIYYLFRALVTTSGIRGRAAAMLGISPWRLRTRLVAHDLPEVGKAQLVNFGDNSFPKPNMPPGLAPDWAGLNMNLDEIMVTVEKHFISTALAKSEGNQTEAASLLGLSRRSFQHRLERTGYDRG